MPAKIQKNSQENKKDRRLTSHTNHARARCAFYHSIHINFSVGCLVGFLLFLGAFILYQYILSKRPTVVTADSEKLVYKQLFSSTEIWLTDIDRISCEPYFVNGRYHSEQRIRIMIYTKDDELELSDHVDTNTIINDKLEEKDTDIPLIRLYRFLMKQTGRMA